MKTKIIILAGIILLFSLALFAKDSGPLVRFDISPNPMKDVCEIALEFDVETAITLVIMSEEEEVVKTVYIGPAFKSGTYKWDRLDALGNWVPSGTYFVVVNYQSRYTSTKKTLILK